MNESLLDVFEKKKKGEVISLAIVVDDKEDLMPVHFQLSKLIFRYELENTHMSESYDDVFDEYKLYKDNDNEIYPDAYFIIEIDGDNDIAACYVLNEDQEFGTKDSPDWADYHFKVSDVLGEDYYKDLIQRRIKELKDVI